MLLKNVFLFLQQLSWNLHHSSQKFSIFKKVSLFLSTLYKNNLINIFKEEYRMEQ